MQDIGVAAVAGAEGPGAAEGLALDEGHRQFEGREVLGEGVGHDRGETVRALAAVAIAEAGEVDHGLALALAAVEPQDTLAALNGGLHDEGLEVAAPAEPLCGAEQGHAVV